MNLDKIIKNALLFDDMHVGVYAGDEEFYTIFKNNLEIEFITFKKLIMSFLSGFFLKNLYLLQI